MFRGQAENVIKTIIREIAQRCANKGQAVSATLSAFMVKVIVLDPRNEFNIEQTLRKEDVEKLIQLCVDRLLDPKSPAVDTIKMQIYFDMNYASQGEYLHEHQKVVQAQMLPLSQDIMDSRPRRREDLDAFYRKIVSYVMLRSGLGAVNDITAIRETTAALQSVFPQAELAAFVTLLKKDKEQQLNELTKIVTGIRLFNKDSGKGGESIEDLPSILLKELPATTSVIESDLEKTRRLAWRYSTLLEKPPKPDADDSLNRDLLTQAVYNLRQHEAFLKLILSDVTLCGKQAEFHQTDFTVNMKLLKGTVHAKTAVPTSQVFPYFTALARLWTGLQDEMLWLKMLNSVAANLKPFLSDQYQLLEGVQLEQLFEGLAIKTDKERTAESSEEKVDPKEMESCEWLLPDTIANFDELSLQYGGMCGHTLITKNGLLLPGNPNIGVLKYRDKYFCFSSKYAAYQFASKADESIELVAERAKRSPELIQLLKLHQQFASITPFVQVQSGEKFLVKAISRSDNSTQTVTHPVESNIVDSYEWNEWELRRKAIKLTNLRSKITHAMQTNLSHMRRDNISQTYPLKDSACQTMLSSGSNVPKLQTFLAGLRGAGNAATQMIKFDLTAAVDE